MNGRAAFERRVDDAMAERLSPLGFRLNRSKEVVWRKFDGGMLQLTVGVITRGVSFQVSLAGMIRLDPVEDVLRNVVTVAPGYEKWTVTSITKQPFFGMPDAFDVAGPDDIPWAVDQLANVATELMIPFLEARASVAAFDHAYNVDTGPNFDITMAPHQGLVAVTVAWLAGSPHLDRVIRERRLQFETYDPPYQVRLARLLDYIATHEPER